MKNIAKLLIVSVIALPTMVWAEEVIEETVEPTPIVVAEPTPIEEVPVEVIEVTHIVEPVEVAPVEETPVEVTLEEVSPVSSTTTEEVTPTETPTEETTVVTPVEETPTAPVVEPVVVEPEASTTPEIAPETVVTPKVEVNNGGAINPWFLMQQKPLTADEIRAKIIEACQKAIALLLQLQGKGV